MPSYWIYLALFAAAGLVFLTMRKRARQKAETASSKKPDDDFVIKPYLQLGDTPLQRSDGLESLEVHWFADRRQTDWHLEYRLPNGVWLLAGVAQPRAAALFAGKTPLHWQATITDLPAGSEFDYRVLLGKSVLFSSTGKCRVAPGQPFRFAVYGDIANGSAGSKELAAQVALTKADILVLAGDLAYKRGRMSEYLTLFMPVCNADSSDPRVGGPIMRERIVLSVAGNHDLGIQQVGETGDLKQHPDMGAFYVLWSQPLNGPLGAEATSNIPPFHGGPELMRPMLDASGDKFPRMTNFAFDCGDSHWLMLDANWYMDWTNPALRDWVVADLRSSDKRWKFVVFHQPPFTTDVKHADEQHMRLLAGIFESEGVDVVFSGHNHTYERCFPLRFTPTPRADGKPKDERGRVAGTFEFDYDFDGKHVTTKRGVLYIVSGGGGANQYLNPERRADAHALPPYTYKLVDDIHSFTICDLEWSKLTFRQLAADGSELDHFVITK